MAKKKKSVEKTGTLLSPKVRCMTFGDVVIKADTTSSNAQDVFSGMYGQGSELSIIAPPFDPLALLATVEYSDILGQCIDAMAINIDGFGWQLKKAEHLEKDKDLPEDAKTERASILKLFNYCNPDIDFIELRKRLRKDLEGSGTAYMEVVKNGKEEIAELYQLQSYSMRITEADKDATEYDEKIRNEDGSYESVSRLKKFRRYVQVINVNKTYFKEFGDPRTISSTTGKEENGTKTPATEVIIFKLYCPYSIYGQPRWVGNILGIMGSRKAEEINYLFFDNKSIPPLVVTISGGTLTEEASGKLENLFKNEIKGTQNFHKGILLEAVPSSVSPVEGEKVTPVKIDVKPLTHFIQDDALFKEYTKEKQNAVISSFRLAPIFVGKSLDYTRATALTSAIVTEEQVFQPERNGFDYIVNRKIFSALAINNWDFVSQGGKTTDDSENVKALSGVKEALPLVVINAAVAEMLGIEMPEIPEELKWIPLGLITASMGGAMPIESESTEKAFKFVMKIRDRLEEAMENIAKQEGKDGNIS